MLDAERQIRFLYPPLFLIGSVLLGIRLDDNVAIGDVVRTAIGQSLLDTIGTWSTGAVAVATASGLVLTIATGFLISSVTVLFLRFLSPFFESGSYEAVHLVNPDVIRKRLGVSGSAASDALFLSATLDHELVKREIQGMSLRLLKFSGGSVDDYAICRSS